MAAFKVSADDTQILKKTCIAALALQHRPLSCLFVSFSMLPAEINIYMTCSRHFSGRLEGVSPASLQALKAQPAMILILAESIFPIFMEWDRANMKLRSCHA